MSTVVSKRNLVLVVIRAVEATAIPMSMTAYLTVGAISTTLQVYSSYHSLKHQDFRKKITQCYSFT